MSETKPEHGLAPNRVEGLADAVFAIVLTLLVIDIHAPAAHSTGELAAALADRWPDFLGYGLSFIILAIMWFGHRMEFHYITRMDRQATLLSLLFLGTVTVIPFTASLLERNIRQPLAVAIFGMNLCLATTLRCWHWYHASRHHRLIKRDTPEKMIKTVRRREIMVPLLYLVAAGLSALSVALAIVVYVTIPAAYVVRASVDPALEPAFEDPKSMK